MPIAVPMIPLSTTAAKLPAGASCRSTRQSATLWFQPAAVLSLNAPSRSSDVNTRITGSAVSIAGTVLAFLSGVRGLDLLGEIAIRRHSNRRSGRLSLIPAHPSRTADARLQLLEPVEDDVNFRSRGRSGCRRSGGDRGHEPAVRSDVKIPTGAGRPSQERSWHRHGIPEGKRRTSRDAHRLEYAHSGNVKNFS